MILRAFVLSLIINICSYSAIAQVTLDNTMTVEELINNVLLGEGVTASNITYNGMPGNQVGVQVGRFSMADPASPFPIDSGVVISTSFTTIVNDGGEFSNSDPFPNLSDPDLVEIAGYVINDAAIIEFDFTAASDSIKFDYVFASAEYPSYTCQPFNDIFGFFLSGPGIAGPFQNDAINIALIPGTQTPVGVNSVNAGLLVNSPNCLEANPNYVNDSIYFVDNDPAVANSIQIRGHTVSLPAVADIECGTYHVKLAIGNSGGDNGNDRFLQSAVFLREGSFQAIGDVTISALPTIGGDAVSNPLYDSVLVAGCSEATIELIKPGGLTIDSVYVEFGGTAIQQTGDEPIDGADYILSSGDDTLNLSFPQGQDTISFSINTLWDGVPDQNEFIVITLFYFNSCGDLSSASDTLFIVDPYILSSTTENVVLSCPAETVTVSALGLNGIEPYTYDWGDYGVGEGMEEANVDIPADSAYYVVAISDVCGFESKLDSVLVVSNIPDPLQAGIDTFTDPDCPNQPIDLNASIQGGNGDYTIIWQDGNGGSYQAIPSITVGNVNSTIIFDPEPVNFIDNLPMYLTVIDTCGTMVRDTVLINYPYFDPITTTFNKLTDNCPTEPLELRAAVENGSGEFEYNWGISSGSFTTNADPNGQNTYVIPSSGINTYTLVVTDFCSRQGFDYNYIVNDSELAFSGLAAYEDSLDVIKLDKIMNVITPNGDNKNDYFFLEGVDRFDDARLDVFDRWGKLVYGTDNYRAGDLTVPRPDDVFDADGLNDGTYFYVINIDSGECVESGTIEVLRNNN